MRVIGSFNNTLQQGKKSSASRSTAAAPRATQEATSGFGPRRQKADVPGQESLSRSEILRRMENQNKPKNEPAAQEASAVVEVKEERPAPLVRPIWDDAGQDDPPAIQTAPKAIEKAQELAGVEQQSEVKSDVALNRPDDPATTNKLKHVLASGSFNFSEKEKEALKNILGT